ncbi:MAG: membrane protein insertion efficiency factor YidD [Deltaproteobacteria bacterium]|jgi:putative membrane protein insertion efficiency factor|nr:membrane protein insertion efficiency factor YidD [Deltaproteobacteria bacterium]
MCALFFIGSYRTFGTQFLGGNCRFIPSCSEFAKEAFNEHDFLCALKMTLGRLSKCHPFGSFGYDPVPERKCNARTATN